MKLIICISILNLVYASQPDNTALPKSNDDNEQTALIILFSIVGAIVLLVYIIMIVCYCRDRRKSNQTPHADLEANTVIRVPRGSKDLATASPQVPTAIEITEVFAGPEVNRTWAETEAANMTEKVELSPRLLNGFTAVGYSMKGTMKTLFHIRFSNFVKISDTTYTFTAQSVDLICIEPLVAKPGSEAEIINGYLAIGPNGVAMAMEKLYDNATEYKQSDRWRLIFQLKLLMDGFVGSWSYPGQGDRWVGDVRMSIDVASLII